MSEPNIDNELDFTPDTDMPHQCYRRPSFEIGTVTRSGQPDAVIIEAAELARLRLNAARWECFSNSGHLMIVDFNRRESGTFRATKEAAVDAAIAAEKGAGDG